SRTMPILSPDETTPQPLEIFPTDAVTQAATDAAAKVTKQATDMSNYAIQINQHLPLVVGELPKPTDAQRYEYANKYAEVTANYDRWQKILDSTPPPSPAEVTAEKDNLFSDIKKARLALDPQGNPDPQSMTEAQAQYDEESGLVQPRMELERAQQHRIY